MDSDRPIMIRTVQVMILRFSCDRIGRTGQYSMRGFRWDFDRFDRSICPFQFLCLQRCRSFCAPFHHVTGQTAGIIGTHFCSKSLKQFLRKILPSQILWLAERRTQLSVTASRLIQSQIYRTKTHMPQLKKNLKRPT